MKMNNIQIKNLNILDTKTDVIAHIVNCWHVMGAGVALALRNKWPEVFEADLDTMKGDENKLGKFSIACIPMIEEDRDLFILNNYAQYNYGTEKRQLNYEFLYQCLEKNLNFLKNNNLRSISYPYGMGCGLAGGNWEIVYKMIEEIYKNSDIQVIICKI